MAFSKSPPPHQVKPETETTIPQNSDAPTDPKSAGTLQNPAEGGSENPIQKSADAQSDTKTVETQEKLEESIEEGEEEEEGECGFCLFMKGGGCKDTFVEWEKCVEEGEKNKEDIVEKCFQVTAALKNCMEAHSDYYAPLLQAEKAAEAEVMKQLEEEKANQEGDGQELGTKEKEEALVGSEQKEAS